MMDLFRKFNFKPNEKSTYIRPKGYAGCLYYSKRSVYSADFSSHIISLENMSKIRQGFYNQSQDCVSCGVWFNEKEWADATEGLVTFDNFFCDIKYRGYDCTRNSNHQFAYLPESFIMYDVDSITEYSIVFIDDEIEVRQADYFVENELVFDEFIDQSTEIVDTAVIKKMENTVLAALKVLNLRKKGVTHKKSASDHLRDFYAVFIPQKKELNNAVQTALDENDIWLYLDENDYVKYVDVDDLENLLFNINCINARYTIPLIEPFNIGDMTMMEILSTCSQHYVATDYELIAIKDTMNSYFVTLCHVDMLSGLDQQLANYQLAMYRFSSKNRESI